jgi:hypothetical protein
MSRAALVIRVDRLIESLIPESTREAAALAAILLAARGALEDGSLIRLATEVWAARDRLRSPGRGRAPQREDGVPSPVHRFGRDGAWDGAVR